MTPAACSSYQHGLNPTDARAVTGGAGDGLYDDVLVEGPNLVVTGNGLSITNTAGEGVRHIVSPDVSIHVASIYFRIDAMPASSTVGLWRFNVNSTQGAFIRLRAADAKLVCSVGPGGATQESSFGLSRGVVYRFDLLLDRSTNPGTMDWQVAVGDGPGAPQPRCVGPAAAPDSGRWLEFADFLGTGVAYSWTVVSYVVSNVAVNYPLGPHRVVPFWIDQLVPAEHQGITLTQWQTTPDFAAFTDFTGQNETVSRALLGNLNVADGIRMTSAGAVAGNARWKMAKPSYNGASPTWGVQLVTCAREASAGVNNVTLRALLNSSTTNVVSGDPGWGTVFSFDRLMMAARPGGGAWTPADVEALRFEMASTDGDPATWLAGVYGEAVIAYGDPSVVGEMLVGRGAARW